MKKRHILILIVSLLIWIIAVLAFIFLFSAKTVSIKGNVTPDFVSGTFINAMALIIVAVLIGLFVAIYIFPAFSMVLAVFMVIRQRKISWKALCPSIFLLLISLTCWNLLILFTNGAGYYFHHDFGSKVYNEGYIIPYYQEMYGEDLELASKNVIDAYNAEYILKSGITGKTFSVKSSNYDVGAGVTDRLHLSADYRDILGIRLQTGEKIALPFDHIFDMTLEDGRYSSLDVWRTKDGYKISADSHNENFGQNTVGDKFYVKLDGENLVLEIPVEGGNFSTHYLQVSNPH